MVNVKVPGLEGVPLIIPVLFGNVPRPGGSDPELIEYVYGDAPPLAVTV